MRSPEEIKSELIQKDDYDITQINNTHSFKSIAGLFEGKKTAFKEITVSAKTIEKTVEKQIKNIPSIRYLGAVADQTGDIKYYLKNETKGTLLKLRKGDSLDGIVLVSVEDNQLKLSIEGVEIEINK